MGFWLADVQQGTLEHLLSTKQGTVLHNNDEQSVSCSLGPVS